MLQWIVLKTIVNIPFSQKLRKNVEWRHNGCFLLFSSAALSRLHFSLNLHPTYTFSSSTYNFVWVCKAAYSVCIEYWTKYRQFFSIINVFVIKFQSILQTIEQKIWKAYEGALTQTNKWKQRFLLFLIFIKNNRTYSIPILT